VRFHICKKTNALEVCRQRPSTVSQGDTSHHLYFVKSGEGHADIFIDGVSHNDTSGQRATSGCFP
jgi:hypothetical protein